MEKALYYNSVDANIPTMVIRVKEMVRSNNLSKEEGALMIKGLMEINYDLNNGRHLDYSNGIKGILKYKIGPLAKKL
jgi:hypothetical protein